MPPPRTSARPNIIMSERQQMALLIQMTATPSSDVSRQHIKKMDNKKLEEIEEVHLHEKQEVLDGVRDKSFSEEQNVDSKNDSNFQDNSTLSNVTKRNFSDIEEEEYDEYEDFKKKKRKDSDSSNNTKAIPNLRFPARIEKNVKQPSAAKSSPTSNKGNASTDKEFSDSTKISFCKNVENDGEDDDFKLNENIYSGGLKVPPLKIVIPQQNCSIDTDGNVSRTGKINASRSAALPYVVSSNNESNDRDIAQCHSPHESPIKGNTVCNVIDEKNMKLINEEKNLHRVLRSSHRTGATSLERSSNNSSPQMQSSSPSPASSNIDAIEGKISSPLQQSQNYDNDNIVNLPSPSTSSTSEIHSNTVELHPRKRKIRSKNEENNLKPMSGSNICTENSDTHPHDFPFTNCFQMFLNIRRQIEKKFKNVYPIKPRPPQGYGEYLLNKRTYLLIGNKDETPINIPNSISSKMKEIFLIQEKERKDLFHRHTVEREKLCLNVEQEIIRVHSKAARNISCQSLPYSVCTVLKDEELYNVITPEQEEKEKNARFRFNGRLLLSWLQDVDDKWEKIKESMVLRHHNEAESLHAVQLMDWEIALKKFELCDYKSQLVVEKDHVPIVFVSDDFDLLPA